MGEAAWIKRDGAPAVVATVLGWAREAAGTEPSTLVYNDFNTGEETVKLLKGLQERNALPDASVSSRTCTTLAAGRCTKSGRFANASRCFTGRSISRN